MTFAQADVVSPADGDGALAAESLDHVFVRFLLEHLSRRVEALTRLRSMLKAGGREPAIAAALIAGCALRRRLRRP